MASVILQLKKGHWNILDATSEKVGTDEEDSSSGDEGREHPPQGLGRSEWQEDLKEGSDHGSSKEFSIRLTPWKAVCSSKCCQQCCNLAEI